MKQLTILAFFLLWASLTLAQDFTKIDAHARSTPFPQKQDTKALAQALSVGCTTEKEKVRAFFVWIADNIKYDINSLKNIGNLDSKEWEAQVMPHRVLRTKKAVCEGYSNLLVALCEASGIKALQVEGITKNYKGKVSRAGHAWCLVRADGVWGLIDATWGAGEVDLDEGRYYKKFKENYFFSPPEVLIADHWPYDPLFQLLPNPITMESFKQAKIDAVQKPTAMPREGFAQITDSLNAFVALDSVSSLFSVGKRTLGIDPASNYGLYHMGYYRFEKGEKAMAVYLTASNERQKNKAKITAKWCDQQTEYLQKWKAEMSNSVKILSRTSRNDSYTDSIQSIRLAAESHLNAIEKETSYLKQLRNTIK